MRYILAVFFLAYSSVALGAGELSFTAADIQEHKVQSTAAADPDIEARLNAPDDPIPPPRLLPINDPPPAPPRYPPTTTVARPAVPVQTVLNRRPGPGVAVVLPQKRAMTKVMTREIAQDPRLARPVTAVWKPLTVSKTVPQYARYFPKKTMVALMTKKRKKSKWTRAIVTHRRPATKRVAAYKPKKMI